MKGAVAVFIPTIYRTGKHRYIQHLSEKLAEKGYHTYCFCTHSDLYWQEQLENNERSVFQLYERTEIKAAVIYSELIKDNKLCEKIVKNLKQKEIPVFTIERPIENAFNIVYDHAMGFGKIVDHIIEKHHAKNIYMLSGMRDNAFSSARNEAYRKSLESHGIPFDEKKIYYGEFWDGPARREMEQLLKDAREVPDAIVCANDIMAISACLVLESHGIQVPGDIIVTGYDGTDRAKVFYPAITTSEPDYFASADYICDIIENYERGTERQPENISIGGVLSLGMSCGCKMTEKKYSSAVFAMQYEEFMQHKLIRYENDRMMLRNIGKRSLPEVLGEMSYNISTMKLPGVEVYLNLTYLGSPNDNGRLKLVAAMNEKEPWLVLPYTELAEGKICSDTLLSLGNPVLFLPLYGNNRNYGYAAFSLNPGNIADCEKIYDLVMHLNVLLSSIETYVKLNDLYIRDQLTGLLNRRGFYQELDEVIKRAENENRELLVVSADMNGLKGINDNYGHAEGDFAITAAGNALKQTIGDLGICARFGGDEYLAVMMAAQEESALQESLMAKLRQINATGGKPYQVSMSIGIERAVPVEAKNDLQKLVKAADEKMYLQKAARGDQRR